MDKKKTLNVRSSAAEFLIFSMQEEADTIEVLYKDENLWLDNVIMHLNYRLRELFIEEKKL